MIALPTSSPEDERARTHDLFTRAMPRLSKALIGGSALRQDPNSSLFGTHLTTIVPPPDAESQWRSMDLDLVSIERISATRLSELLADLSPEVSGALNDFLRFCNPGFDITAMRPGGDTPDPRAQKALDAFLDTLRSLYGSLDVVVNRLFMAAFMRGAFLAELVLDKRGRLPVDLVVPDPAVVRFRRRTDEVRGDVFELGQYQGAQFVVFDRPTIRYIPIDPFPSVPYGRPMVAPAIFLALFNLGLLRDIRRVVAQQGYPRLDISIDLAQLFASLPPGLNDLETFSRWADQTMTAVEQQYARVRPEDAYVHLDAVTVNRPVGTLDSGSLGAVDGLMKAIERGLARALKASPISMNLTEGTSEAQANRQWEIHAARIKSVQHFCETILGDLLGLALEAQGIQATVKVAFAELRSSELMRDAQVQKLTIENASAAQDRGWIDQAQAAKEGFGVDEPALAEKPAPPAAGPGATKADMANPEPGSARATTITVDATGVHIVHGARHNQPGDHPLGREFGSIEEASWWANDQYSTYNEGVPEKQLASVLRYVDTSEQLNSSLRSGGEGGSYAQDVRNIDAFIENSPPTDREIVVYRGMDVDAIEADLADALKYDTMLVDRAFTSTTLDPSVAENFRSANRTSGFVPLMASIIIPQGSRVGYLEHFMEEGSGFDGSFEVLVPRRTAYKVLRYDDEPGYGKVIVLEAQLVPVGQGDE